MVLSLRAAAIGMVVWAAVAMPQRPSALDADAAIEKSRAIALDYARSLPNFVCTETVRRYSDTRGRGQWVPEDTLTVKLSYFEQKEQHQLTLIDGKPTGQVYETLTGARGMGEFGGTLHGIFDPASAAQFRWESWKNVRKHRVAVYNYVVDQSHSRYMMETGSLSNIHKAIVAFHGVIEIDSETGQVLHFTYIADRIPRELSLNSTRTTVDYDFADVGGRDYLLPASSETVMVTPRIQMKNQMTFTEYRKFGSESTITFGADK
jgi:hypothetical protein